MIGHAVLLAAAAVVAILLDTVVLAHLTVAGVAPSTTTVMVIGLAFADGPGPGLRYGFGVGLLLDVLGDGLVGASALVLVIAGYSIGVGRRLWTGPPLPGQLLAGGIGAAGVRFGQTLLALLFDQTEIGLATVVGQVAMAGLFGLMLAPLIMPPLTCLSRRFTPVRVTGGPQGRD